MKLSLPNTILIGLIVFVIGALAIGRLVNSDDIEKAKQLKNEKKERLEVFHYKHAGTYEVVVEGVKDGAKELYKLKKNGNAEWLWVQNGLVESHKTGAWDGEDKSLSIEIQGNTGKLTERFFLYGDTVWATTDVGKSRQLVKQD